MAHSLHGQYPYCNPRWPFHRKCVHCIHEKPKEHNLYLKPEKCKFEKWRVKFLGVILENRTVQMDPAKLKGVTDWLQPQHITDVHTFLGFTGFYCYFMPNYSNITQPLIQLTKNNGLRSAKSPLSGWKHWCVATLSYDHQTTPRPSSLPQTPQLMAWVPYSCRREKSTPALTNPCSALLPIIQPPLLPHSATTTSMSKNS